MGGRNVMVVATVLAAIGVITIGAWWLAADERGGKTRPSTAPTSREAAQAAEALVEDLAQQVEVAGVHVPVLRCKLATPRQRYSCSNARRLTVANMAAEILQPADAAHRTTSCVVKTPNGDLWLVDTVGRCL
jgi:hypothetical protein